MCADKTVLPVQLPSSVERFHSCIKDVESTDYRPFKHGADFDATTVACHLTHCHNP